MVLAATWGVGQVVLTFLWFMLLFIWIWLMISVFIDIFRSDDMGGLHKALWIVGILLFNLLGVLLYLIIRGDKMRVHSMNAAKQQDEAMQNYIRQAAGTGSAADELHRLADLKDRGVIDDAEFQKLKAKIV